MNQTLKGYVNANSSGNLQHWGSAEWGSGTWFETDVILGRNIVVNSSVLSSVTTHSNIVLTFAISGNISSESDVYARFTTWLVGVCTATSSNLQEWSNRDKWGEVIWGEATWSSNLQEWSNKDKWGEVIWGEATWSSVLTLLTKVYSISGTSKAASICGVLALLTKAYSISGTSNAASILGAYLSKNKYIASEINELSGVIGNITLPKVLIGSIGAVVTTPYTNLDMIFGLFSNVNATTHITARPLSTQTTEEYRLVPLSKYIFDNAVLSLQMNSEMSNIYRWLDGLTHGTDIVYGGRYKLKFNKTLNTLDIVYNKQMFTYNGNGDRDYNTTEDTVVARIFSNGNVSIKGTLTQSASL